MDERRRPNPLETSAFYQYLRRYSEERIADCTGFVQFSWVLFIIFLQILIEIVGLRLKRLKNGFNL